ncbi:MAG: hypothetical protein ACRDE2_13600, partial [Chitinophagaceae bacterium]
MQRLALVFKCAFSVCICSFIFLLSAQAQPLPSAWSYKSLQWNAPFNIPDLNNFRGIQWEKTGHLFTKVEREDNGYDIVEYDPANQFSTKIIVTSSELTAADSSQPLRVESYTWYPEHQKMIIFTNSKRVWRAHTRGDFWIYDAVSKKLFQLG